MLRTDGTFFFLFKNVSGNFAFHIVQKRCGKVKDRWGMMSIVMQFF
jgi:hypothetical protein